MELATAIAMKIASPNDTNPDCTTESGVTYGTANRYASSTGDDSGKMVDTFDGREGQADEINTNTSCATLSMSPNSYDSTYSDVTVYTNSPTGYALTVQSAENVSPNLVNTSDSNEYIPAGALTESGGTVTGGQNKWAYKTNNGIITDWTAVTTSPAPIKSYATYTEGGDTTRVTYGVSTGSNPTGKYATTLTYTTTMFDDANPYIDYMQDFSADDHISDLTNTEYTIVDSRDSKTYTAAKLADGNIWMTEDLKLGGDSAITLTPANSDVSSNYTLPAENTGTWCTDANSTCYNQSLMIKTGAPNGYLYNWYAATAGTGTYSTSANQNATASICPKGWKLPTKDQYVALDQAYGGSGSNRTGDTTQVNKFLATPLNFNYTGYRNGGSVLYPSANAIYWSRTATSETNAYYLNFDSNGGFTPQNLSYKYYGFAVRCVADSSEPMQSFSASAHASDAVGTTYNLEDLRDGQKYSAAKLADGNIWMTQNLRLVGPRVLTSLDSNISSDFTLPASDGSRFCMTNNSISCDGRANVLNSGNTSYGTYYNWYAATAGTGTYSLSSGNASSSICPKGWKIPTSSEFQTLYNNYSSPSAIQGAPAFVLSGYRGGSNTEDQGSGGYYWSSTARDNDYAHDMRLNSFTVYPQPSSGKFFGLTIRCVASS